MATMDFDIYLIKYKGDALVEQLQLVHADLEMGFWDGVEEFLTDVGNFLVSTLESRSYWALWPVWSARWCRWLAWRWPFWTPRIPPPQSALCYMTP